MNNLNGAARDSRPVFNIKAVVTKTGLSSSAIRAWERRYGFPRPNRTAGGHRQYSQLDIETLQWLKARQEEGISISHAIDLWHSYIDREEDPLQVEAPTLKEPAVRSAPVIEGSQIDQFRQAWISACLAFDRETAEQILVRAFALFNPETVCVELLQMGLVEVGNGWYNGHVTIQQEHFTSALSLQRLEMLISATAPPTRPERIIVATAPGDFHIFSPLLLTFLLRQRGWDVIYLGANVPADELESTIQHIQPELIIVSAQLLHTAATLKEIALTAQAHGVTLAFGGLIFNQMPELRHLIPGYFLGESLQDAVQSVAEAMMQKLPASQWVEPSDSYQRALTQYSERRALIESHLWSTFITSNKPTEHLSSINNDIAQTIEAALELGDMGLLSSEIVWIKHLLMSYRLSKPLIADYIMAYYQAARIHLDEPSSIVVDWLAQLVTD
jgi:DNA-binding transcriptional MerR regulator/methylmalonyl-CoA mutase cobalamin-binding subunit